MFFSYVKQKFYIFCTYLWIFFIIHKNQCGTLSGNIKKRGASCEAPLNCCQINKRQCQRLSASTGNTISILVEPAG